MARQEFMLKIVVHVPPDCTTSVFPHSRITALLGQAISRHSLPLASDGRPAYFSCEWTTAEQVDEQGVRSPLPLPGRPLLSEDAE